MGNKPILLPVEKSDLYTESNDWIGLKNRFSGKMLFRSNLYNLITGNLSVLDKADNNWFYKEILQYANSTLDINFLPVLKKIASGSRFGESLRQQATELMEIIEMESIHQRNGVISSSMIDEASRAANARRILAGARYPQTTEILRLLRDKSPGLKRLALYLIGKFKVTDMIQEVCECMNIQEVGDEAYSVLSEFGNEAGKELNRFYLKSSGNINTSKTILRLFSQICPKENIQFIFERLWTNSRQIKEMALKTLLNCGYKPDEEEKVQLRKLIFDIFGLLTWILSVKVSLNEKNNKSLTSQISKEFSRWKKFLLNLLILTFEKPIAQETQKRNKSDDYSKFIPELAEIIYTDVNPKKKNLSDTESDNKKLKKLQRYFPCEIPPYETLSEDIINCDYNLLNVWTKACAIRNISSIDSEHLRESVTALLFSPEWILKEEAAMLVARSDRKVYADTSDRVPDQDRIRIESIISEKTDKKDLLFEKTIFLVSVFPEISEEELVFLAERISYHKNISPGAIRQLTDSVVWSLTSEAQISKIRIIYDKWNEDDNNSDLKHPDSFCYTLPLRAVELFRIYYPESSFVIFKFIESVEE